MAQTTQVDNKFIGGLKTEFTGLNFPPDSCTETFDCIFGRTGIVSRRVGFDIEVNGVNVTIDRTNKAVATYYWRNVVGDGLVSIVVVQVGVFVYFYRSSDATLTSPLSTTKLVSTISLSDFGNSPDITAECQFADGNGYLFIFHPNCEPIAVSYSAGVLTGTAIQVKTRDVEGIAEVGIEDTFRSNTLTTIHQYNLQNQGWNNAPAWTATSSTSNDTNTGSHTWTVTSGLTITPGQLVSIVGSGGRGPITELGSVTSYAGTTLVINVTSTSQSGLTETSWTFTSANSSQIQTWNTATGNYPSNSDVWWLYKNSSGVFSPATTYNNITLNAGPAPKGFYIMEAFNQQRSAASGISGLTAVATGGIRPSTGCWFQGRVWYSGVNFLGLNERVYFSQIIENTTQFGKCYQINDPTSQDRFDLLPSDGGVVVIQGSGSIYKLFPIVNGLLVFAERGVWFITGSQGIGFNASDYTVTKISNIPTISAASFVDVLGYPIWCNEDGIYRVTTAQQGAAAQYTGLSVTPITYGTIASFYQDIPLVSKRYMRGYFDYLDYKVQWLYRSTPETSVTSRYTYSNILNMDTITGAFYPWTISPSSTAVNSIIALGGNGNANTEPYIFKYLITTITNLSFAALSNTNYLDWATTLAPGVDYTSYFTTGYRVYTKANTLGQIPYVDIHSVGGGLSKAYLQSRWDFTTSGDAGRWSSPQRLNFDGANRAYETKRRRLTGQGRAVQLKFSSIAGSPMSLIGWSTWITANEIP